MRESPECPAMRTCAPSFLIFLVGPNKFRGTGLSRRRYGHPRRRDHANSVVFGTLLSTVHMSSNLKITPSLFLFQLLFYFLNLKKSSFFFNVFIYLSVCVPFHCCVFWEGGYGTPP